MPDTVNLFNRVARRYDSLNTFFSMGMDRLWRRRLAKAVSGSKTVLDIATGTGESRSRLSTYFPKPMLLE